MCTESACLAAYNSRTLYWMSTSNGFISTLMWSVLFCGCVFFPNGLGEIVPLYSYIITVHVTLHEPDLAHPNRTVYYIIRLSLHSLNLILPLLTPLTDSKPSRGTKWCMFVKSICKWTAMHDRVECPHGWARRVVPPLSLAVVAVVSDQTATLHPRIGFLVWCPLPNYSTTQHHWLLDLPMHSKYIKLSDY